MSRPTTGADAVSGDEVTRIGRYIVLGRAGAGAMGTVHMAYDPDLDRRVAIKVLRGTVGSRRERVRREALAMARISHPNVVQIYEVGEHQGRLFISMEYVAGETLGTWQVDRAWDEIIQMYVAVGRGLAAAHDAGLVHRDFKPDNVLVGSDGRPRIIDFGLARAPAGEDMEPDPRSTPAEMHDSAELLKSPLTRTGHLLGTPAYMSPEQMAGDAPTAASDQFAFAVALFEAIYGEPPFARDSLAGLRLAISRGDVAAPGSAEVPRLVFDDLVRALAADPGDRWPAIDTLLDRLAEHAGDDDVKGWRARIRLIGGMSVMGLGCLGAFRLFGPSPTAMDLLTIEIVITSFIVLAIAVFWRLLMSSPLNRMLAAWLVLVTIGKMSMVSLGVIYDVRPEATHAFDTVMVAVMNGVSALMVRWVLWPAFAISLACLAGIMLWPAAVYPLHDLTMLVIPLNVILATIYKGGALRSRPSAGREGRG